MMPRLTGEEFTYTFKSEISNDRLADYKKLQERMNHAALTIEGYLGQELSFVPSPSNNGYSCIARVKFISLQICLT